MVIVTNTVKKGTEKNPRRAHESKKQRALRAAKCKKREHNMDTNNGNAYSKFIDALERSTKF